MNIKNQKEIEIMRHGGKILASALRESKKICKPGVKTIEIDRFVEKLIKDKKAEPSFQGFNGYRYATCISINEEVVHTMPSERIIKDGDLVSIDIGVCYKGYHNDAAISVGVGKVSDETRKLINVTDKSLKEAIKLLKPGIRIGDVQATIQGVVEREKFQLVRDLSGHGIGRRLQEAPSIPNLGKKGTGFILQEGMTFCLEPMVSLGDYRVCTMPDQWSVVTCDRSLSAHFEHTILITKKGCEVFTSLD
jgi:methionyl aminopeptidase